MEVNRIFSAEQIVVKPELPGILKDYSKALIRENPDDIYAFSAEYFRQKAGVGGAGVGHGEDRATGGKQASTIFQRQAQRSREPVGVTDADLVVGDVDLDQGVRRERVHPDEEHDLLKILKELFGLDPGGYRRSNEFWTANAPLKPP